MYSKVLEFIPFEENNVDYPMVDVVARLHHADRPKLVIAYIDVGQAEDYRTNWEPDWGIGDPEWIVTSDPDGWEGNYPVAYCFDEYQEIWLGSRGYLQAILNAGFDGVYLDWVEAYSEEDVMAFADRDAVDPVQEMIWWVGDGVGSLCRPGALMPVAEGLSHEQTQRAFYGFAVDRLGGLQPTIIISFNTGGERCCAHVYAGQHANLVG